MTSHELAFRYIARNDFTQRLFARNIDELVEVCRRKAIQEPQRIAAAIGAYFDELAQETAARLGFCRLCRVRRPTHLHAEPRVRYGNLAESLVGCTEPYCCQPVRHAMAACRDCFGKYRHFVHSQSRARREQLRRRGATVKIEVLR